MDLDQEICVCFHVSRRKIEKFLRLEKPVKAAQLAECFGAGTGCGWCRKYLVQLFEAATDGSNNGMQETALQQVDIPAEQNYRQMRRRYHQDRNRKSTPADESGSQHPQPGSQSGPLEEDE